MGEGKLNLTVRSLGLGEEEGERPAQRDGGRRLAGRAGRRKQESRGGATGDRGRSFMEIKHTHTDTYIQTIRVTKIRKTPQGFSV